MRKHLSIVVPVRNENEFLRPFYYDLLRQNFPYTFELIWVNNASTDTTFEEIQELMEQDAVIRCITLKYEATPRAAVLAGLDLAEGEYVIVMKGDLQHPRNLIPSILQALEEGTSIVNLKPENKSKASKVQRWFFDHLYQVEKRLQNTTPVTDISEFRGFRREVVNDILFTSKNHFFVEAFFNWKDYSFRDLIYENKRCPEHLYKYSFRHLLYSYRQMFRQLEPGRLKKFAFTGLILSAGALLIGGSMYYGIFSGRIQMPLLSLSAPVILFLIGIQFYIFSTYRRKIKEDLFHYSRDLQYVIEHIYEQRNENELTQSEIITDEKRLRKVS